MWILPPSKEEEEAAAKRHAEQWKRACEEASAKARAKEDWLKANTCPHCKQHPPMPPWFY